ncbi:pyruvate kinase [Aureibaculum sp. 2210JD6-5]|uniref:pyruvate kinase n=1 Tax=Aureibaculum sp. 2210JD6-5 TaxID=3103957 RepID=UPI002AAC6537|nr:pyruvate kinase [Aureibaculum sp. 2210JD6-5]MDY7395965.1 pyruvate kinase [Aureibaculum sp. 2210JD6-5]
MRNRKKTKIVATLGPACDTYEIIEEMMTVGVNVFRVNFSHANYENVTEKIKMIREINKKLDYNVAILADLQGPKLRVGVMAEKVKLKKGDQFIFTTDKCEGTQERAYMTYQQFPQDVKPGENILVDDGKLLFKVISTNGKNEVLTEVLRGGKLKSKKGVNLPNTNISQPALTEKDKKDALFAIKMKVDWIALSFVRHADDLKELRALITEHSDFRIPIMAKIEKPEAVTRIASITPHCDGLMVARGDLGVEVDMEKVPLIQKKLVIQAKKSRIPVVIATQMMETMITNQVPTRAEVNDVANSIMDGADAVMLSGETSVGEFPVEVIQKIRSIIENVEDSPLISRSESFIRSVNDRFISKTICYQAAKMADDIGATAITTLTNSGYTAFQISAWRPKTHIMAFSDNRRILAMLNLLWGVKAHFYDKMKSTDDTVEDINQMAVDKRYVKAGDFVINLTSMPVKAKGMVNTLRVSQIE